MFKFDFLTSADDRRNIINLLEAHSHRMTKKSLVVF